MKWFRLFPITNVVLILNRLTSVAQASKTPSDRFTFLLDEFNVMSAVVASQGAQMDLINDQVMVTQCRMFEETCGRINSDNLNHFMVMGAPYFPICDGLQELLRKQVCYNTIFISASLESCMKVQGCIVTVGLLDNIKVAFFTSFSSKFKDTRALLSRVIFEV